jgi:hypothetical protein
VDTLSADSSVKISFEEYLNLLKKFAPDGLTRACPNSSAKTIQDIMKLHRPVLRRIYLKFLATQNDYNARLDQRISQKRSETGAAAGAGGAGAGGGGDGNGDAGKMDLIIFLEFIQNGLIINLQKDQAKVQQQQQQQQREVNR